LQGVFDNRIGVYELEGQWVAIPKI
jgi:hypothetical protein